MRTPLMIVLLTLCIAARSQESKITDKLLEKVCNSIKDSKTENDSLKIIESFQKHLFPVLSEMDSVEAMESWNRALFRLQRQCPVFSKIINRLVPQSGGDWEEAGPQPSSMVKKGECGELRTHTSFTYLEYSGDTVRVTIENGLWTDHFADGTYSKLKFKWTTDCGFELSFIESNNLSRKNLSRPGDKYRYQAVEKGDGYFKMWAWAVGTQRYSTFKFYY